MKNTKLLDLLSKFSSRELAAFSDFVHSPYHNKHKETTLFGDLILALAPDFTHPRKLKKEYLYAKIYPDEVFNNRKFNYLSSQLLHLVYEFLTVQQLREEGEQTQLYLLNGLRKHHAEKQYPYAKKQFFKIQKKSGKRLAQQHYYQYQFYKELNAKFIDEGGREADDNLQWENDALDLFFVLEKLQIACDMANRNIVIKADYQWTLLDTVLEYVEQTELAENKLLKAYKAIFYMLTHEPPTDEPYYHQLKAVLLAYSEEFAEKDLMGLYDYALNYSIRQINRGRAPFYQESLDHYIFLIERKLIFMEGYLLGWDYKNVVTIALRLEKYDWTAQFIEQYKAMLPPAARENTYRYNLASLYFAKGELGEALQTLSDVEFQDPSYYLGAKIIQLKCYFALREGEALYALLDAFESYLRRSKKVSAYRQEANLHLVKLTRRLYKFKTEQAFMGPKKYKEAKAKFEQQLATLSPISNKDWLEANV